MKLYEIIQEHEFPKAKTHIKNVNVPDLYDYEHEDAYHDDEDEPPEKGNPHAENPDIEKLGIGAFASAYKHKDTPQDVTKGSKASTKPDGFQAFFIALSKDKEAQANPYFPRFRNINTFKHKYSAKQSYVVKVESLEPYSNLSKDERKMLMNKIFTSHGKDVINHYLQDIHSYPKDYIDQPNQLLSGAIRAALENQEWGDELRWEIRDGKFKKAIEFLQKTAKEYEYKFDLHSKNIMIRRTSVGVQLVINDPMGFSSSDQDEEDEIEGHPDWE